MRCTHGVNGPTIIAKHGDVVWRATVPDMMLRVVGIAHPSVWQVVQARLRADRARQHGPGHETCSAPMPPP